MGLGGDKMKIKTGSDSYWITKEEIEFRDSLPPDVKASYQEACALRSKWGRIKKDKICRKISRMR
jgi:hypothetical protein